MYTTTSDFDVKKLHFSITQCSLSLAVVDVALSEASLKEAWGQCQPHDNTGGPEEQQPCDNTGRPEREPHDNGQDQEQPAM